jgi:4-amino-4-deoxy-L-arabinose transferase-like glycosyltransferase
VNYQKATLFLIGFLIILKCIIAPHLLLGNDEVYYITYAKLPQWNYFDHPPGVGFLIRLFTLDLRFNYDLLIRLGAIVCGAFSIYLSAARLKDSRTGFFAAVFYSASLYSSIISGFFIMPDNLLMLCWTGSLYFSILIFGTNQINNKQRLYFLFLGFLSGVALLSKAQGIFIWVGLGLYILWKERRWLKELSLYVAMSITALIYFPAYKWQQLNANITYSYHKERIVFHGLHPVGFLKEILGEFFYNNPMVFIFLFISFIGLKYFYKNSKVLLLACFSLPLLFTIWTISFFRDTLPHWTGPSFASLILIASIVPPFSSRVIKKWMVLSISFFLFVFLLAPIFIKFYPGTISSNKDAVPTYGKGDFTLDMFGWDALRKPIDSIVSVEKNNTKGTPVFLVTDNWFPGAHIDHYVGSRLGLKTLVWGPIQQTHHFAWLNELQPCIKKGDMAIYITSSNYFKPPVASINSKFEKSDAPIYLPEYRTGSLTRYYYIQIFREYK